MSWECFRKTLSIAKKEYNCDACDWLDRLDYEELDPKDLETINLAKSEEFKIKKGTKYIHIRGKSDGEFCTFRARIDIDKICQVYDLYPED